MFCFFIGRSYLVRVVDVVVFKEKVVRRLRLGYVFSVKLVLILGNDKEIQYVVFVLLIVEEVEVVEEAVSFVYQLFNQDIGGVFNNLFFLEGSQEILLEDLFRKKKRYSGRKFLGIKLIGYFFFVYQSRSQFYSFRRQEYY